MAKGDDKKRKEEANDDASRYSMDLAGFIGPQRDILWNKFNDSLGGAQADYSNIMGRYQGFADTGGLSEGDKANIRARSVSPIRGMYQRGLGELDRNKALAGGYMPGFAAKRRAFMRDQSTSMSDALTNTEASIAEMTQKGKLAGLAGMSGMYSATPGMSKMYGDMSLASSGQSLEMLKLKTMLADMFNNKKGIDWAKWAQIAGSIGLGAAMVSDKNKKENITEFKPDSTVSKFRKLKLYNWNYKNDPEKKKHVGPMAQDWKKIFDKGDGKSIVLMDLMQETFKLNKELAEAGA